MLFFPPTADLAAAIDPAGAVSTAMDGLLLGSDGGGAAIVPNSAIEQEQRRYQQQAHTLQLQQQLFAMEQQFQQQQQIFPSTASPSFSSSSSFLPMFHGIGAGGSLMPPTEDDLQKLKGAGLPFSLLHSANFAPTITIPAAIVPSSSSSIPSSSSTNLATAAPLLLALAPPPLPPPPPVSPSSQMAMPPTGPCGLCRLPILDKNFLLIDSQSWHLNCVRCCECDQNLEQLGSSCFVKDDGLYCRRDYMMKFGKRCERCGIPIERGQLVMRVPRCASSPEMALFHVQCFTCIFCGQLLTTGEEYTAARPLEHSGGALFCRAHSNMNPTSQQHHPLVPSHFQHGGNTEESPFLVELNPMATAAAGMAPLKEGQAGGQQQSAMEQNSEADTDNLAEARLASLSPGAQSDEFNSGNGADAHSNSGCSSGQKQKRMRTSFKHHQLRTMKTYFSLNHNPDAKDLKQLAQKTGLTKRVLQVWFQNARAKFRRNQQHKHGLICVGSAMLDQPPQQQQQLLLQMGGGGGGGGYQPASNASILSGGQQMGDGDERSHHHHHRLLAAGHHERGATSSLSPIEDGDGASSSCSAASMVSLNAGGNASTPGGAGGGEEEQNSGAENNFQ